MKSSYKIKWTITYERAGDSYGWSANGWSTPDNVNHHIKGTLIGPYWHDSLEQAKDNARHELRRYTDERRFEVETQEEVVL